MQIYYLIFVISLVFSPGSCEEDGGCPGNCVSSFKTCLKSKGQVANSYSCQGPNRFCCVPPSKVIQECSSVASDLKDHYIFASPSFPELSSGNLLCTFTMRLRNDTTGIAIDIPYMQSDGTKPGGVLGCGNDQIFISGFDGFMPDPLCGNISGHQLFIDNVAGNSMKELTIVAMMTSKSYRWFIEVHQLTSTNCSREVGGNIGSAMTTAANQTKARRSVPESSETFVAHPQQNLLITGNHSESQPQAVPMILNGDKSKQGDFPWQVSIRIKSDMMIGQATLSGCDVEEGVHLCGGTIISETEILTAAHCFHSPATQGRRYFASIFKVVVGDLNKCRDGKKGAKVRNPAVQEFSVSKIIMHYNWDSQTGFNDVAILKIKGRINFNKDVQKVALAEKGSDYTDKAGVISGWGIISDLNLKAPDVLQFSDKVRVMNSSTCQAYFKGLEQQPKYKNITSAYICISSKRKVSGSQGDSGGPFVIYKDKTHTHPVLVGVISKREIAGLTINPTGNPITYLASVSFYRNWIDSAMCQ